MKSEPLQRLKLLIGDDKVNRIKTKTVMIFGVGGVGSYAAESLARSGIGKLILIDQDVVEQTNLNRQIQATFDTLGLDKVKAMENRIKEYNKEVLIETRKQFVLDEPIDLTGIDYVVDAIDTVSAKAHIIEECHKQKVMCISSLGMANRFDPSKVVLTTLDKTSYDPLAKAMRDIAKKKNMKYKIKVVFSKEIPIKQNVVVNDQGKTRKEKIPPASTIFVPASAGLLIGSTIIQDIIK